MSVSITHGDGVTMVTLTTDPQSLCPPACQILKTLCWNPTCCSLPAGWRSRERSSRRSSGALGVLGTLQIMVGLLSIGLAVILCQSPAASWWRYDFTAFPYWLGGVFITFGIFSILSEKFPSPCLLIFSSVLQLSGICFSIAAIILYGINLGELELDGCDSDYQYNYWGGERTTPSPSPGDILLKDKCLEMQEVLQFITQGINGVIIALCVLELFVVFRTAIIIIKMLKNFGKEEKQVGKDTVEPLEYEPLVS